MASRVGVWSSRVNSMTVGVQSQRKSMRGDSDRAYWISKAAVL